MSPQPDRIADPLTNYPGGRQTELQVAMARAWLTALRGFPTRARRVTVIRPFAISSSIRGSSGAGRG